MPDRAERYPGGAGSAPPPGATVLTRRDDVRRPCGFLLSEDGRKASLLSGGDGRSLQQITLQVPANRLHLVSVDKQGVARLKLRPRFEMDTTGIVRIGTAPVYDVAPTVEERMGGYTGWRLVPGCAALEPKFDDGRMPVSDLGTFRGLTQFLTQFGFSGSATSP